ncbi:helix-turn-helix domain-containing protein [Streptococcus parauberis]|uniref:helix-turn-helix domain-containing protein n=1 Tax=Streptococcus parauberis TaxID=1348 RepID=UPI000789AC5C|nr:helix-turn-helix transcriptional regulator [Streptococcus parauberis]KYP21666.1 Helix-turn-helix domain protein [Streptococcus parauberis]KYP21841.1 Helix-turn-helix domain protein [Streptococcus parauberis]KYP21941.1 Helix-turn-helix domain protein [Streptococcus parauberis]KYP23733.1 Helix-turn-helix domain protein [Streptococcus parauberis]KYP25354.1 Helix-turn-helix domain protein [Streptococcus parauberis]
MFSTFERIKELTKKQGKSLGQVEEDLNYGRNTLYKIKTSTPNAERVSEIANYFQVSTDYLLGRTDNPKIASSEDKSEVIDFKEIAKESMAFDGHTLNDEDIELIASLLETRMKNRQD